MRLNALLQNSLLFRVVSFDEIQERLAGKRPDHGAHSAIIFLLNFYENGAIHSLEPYKKCAVELAALAIYNHTNKYRYSNHIKEGEYVKNSFVLNPISYLLRLCDDVQEWDRIYFELTNKSNMIVCNTCKTPIVRKKLKNNEDTKLYYSCNCISEENDCFKHSVFRPIFDYDRNFPYRRIYNVIVCENLHIEDREGVLVFKFDYCLDKLLHMAYLNASYAKYRIKELNQLKKMLDYQQKLPLMKLEYFMSANPVFIKVQIIEDYIMKHRVELQTEVSEVVKQLVELEDEENIEKAKIDYENIIERLVQITMQQFSELIQDVYSEDKRFEKIIENVKNTVELYSYLYVCQQAYKRYNQESMSNKKLLEEFAEVVLKQYERECEDLKGILKDCFRQFAYMYEDISKFKSNPRNYYEQFVTDDYAYGCIGRFVAAERYIPILQRKKGLLHIDAYTDLALFQRMLEELRL